MLIKGKIQQAMHDDTIRTTKIHLCNRDEVFLWRNFQPALPYEHIENFTKDLEVRRGLGNSASPVIRAHVKRPLLSNVTLSLGKDGFGSFPESSYSIPICRMMNSSSCFILLHHHLVTYLLMFLLFFPIAISYPLIYPLV